MKIIAIGRNYTAHIEELKNERPSEPVIFMKPDTALLRNDAPFYYPDFSKDIHYEVEVLIKICKEGKYIEEQFAHKYYQEVGIGVDFTARDLQSKCKEKGLPWEIAKGFNGSAPISNFLPKENFNLEDLNFSLSKNGEPVQKGNTSLMLYNFDQIIAYISKFFTLKTGDIIFTGTPAGVGPIVVGDKLEAYIEEEKLLEVEIR
ncbi:fumarylacetoacetate hydrolase family protein [Roseivirga misakiensis]|uniref:2-hydroxyhepta-2,4-diene-1,7-dioate isomerase n=1 Tax=Roseivirga misakiensis TaxID=1563681 RepID=A0A1E5SYS7_9BACT|nr:fumarylacetoacetate hydrolase family protein [Roseivirga misakiensis]OEK04279.1 2-hydroxyhepta-2,4-diene-1,7-dioate isomerase [Roseivirga misakiensis]